MGEGGGASKSKGTTIVTKIGCCCIYLREMDHILYKMVMVMVFNATCNNISVISWLSALLSDETKVPGQKATDLSQVTDKLYYIILYRVHLARAGDKLATFVVIVTDYIDSCNPTTIRSRP